MSPRYRSHVSDREGNAAAPEYSEATAEQIDQEVRKLQDEAYQLARRVLLGDRDKLEVIAKGLLEYETLFGSRIKEIVEHGRLTNPSPSEVPPPGQENAGEKPACFTGSYSTRNGGSDMDGTR